MRNHNRLWTKEEDEKLLKEYKKKGRKQIALEMGRSLDSVTYRYYVVRKKQNKEYIKKFKKADKCPICGGKNINEVGTYYKKFIRANYCLDCFHEFTKDGKIIPPLLKYEGEVL